MINLLAADGSDGSLPCPRLKFELGSLLPHKTKIEGDNDKAVEMCFEVTACPRWEVLESGGC